jgi:hypothetical protein
MAVPGPPNIRMNVPSASARKSFDDFMTIVLVNDHKSLVDISRNLPKWAVSCSVAATRKL